MRPATASDSDSIIIPLRLETIAQDRERIGDLDKNNTLVLLADVHVLAGLLVDRLFVLDAQRHDQDDELLTVEQASRYLKLEPDWLRRRPDLPFKIRLSASCVRYSLVGMRRWLARRAGGRA